MRPSRRNPIPVSVLAVALALTLASASVATNGYFSHGYGTSAKGLAGAGAALPMDAMVVATNPAGLAFVGKRYDAGLALFNPNRQYSVRGNPSGFPGTFGLTPGSVESDSTLFPVPFFAGSWLHGTDTTFGLALYGHGGMNTDYPTSTFYGSSPTGVDFSQLFISGTWARRFGGDRRHAFGVSPLLVYQRFRMQGVQSFAPFSADPAHLSNNGYDDTFGYGIKVGYLGRLTDRFAIGASYQSKLQTGGFDKYAGLFAEQGGFDVPPTWTAGIAVGLSSTVTWVFDVQQIDYSSVKSVGTPLLPNLLLAPLGADDGAGFGWQDMTVYKTGLQWKPGGAWTWRAGFSTGDQPIPDTEVLFNILAPGVMERHATVGVSRQSAGGNLVNLALTRAFPSTVSGPNPLEVPGLQQIELKMDQWELELSYSWGLCK